MGSRLQANSELVRKRIQSHTFDDDNGDEYEASVFGGFDDYFRRKKLKLQNRDAHIRANSANNPPIFRGVVAHVNGYTQPSLNDLHQLIVSHGGGFLQYLDGKTSATHIIASSLTPKKREEFRKYRIVKPAWVVDSVKAGRLLPWDNYRVVDEGASQKVLRFETGTLQTQTNDLERTYKDQTGNSWYNSQFRDATQDLQKETSKGSPSKEKTDIMSSIPNSNADTDYGDFPSLVSPETTKESPAGRDSMATRNDSSIAFEEHEKSNQETTEDGVQNLTKVQLARETIPVKPGMSSEEYNALLLSDPRMKKSSVVNPDFLHQYYRESRLHHLSTWKAELKAKLQAITQEKSDSNKNIKRRVPGTRRYILHVDFDSFFAAVSIKKHHPELVDKPVAIAHGTGSGSEIASCNYPARAFGIKNGMWMKGALDQCPDLEVLPYDFPAYEEASRQFYECILAVDGIVQSVSIDEALVDITTQCLQAGGSDGRGISEGSIYREQAKADEIAKSLRGAIKYKTGCAVSVGIGGNILQAKVALRKAKPAGQFQLKPDEVLDFIGNLTVQDLPGVAYSLGGKLEEIGVKFVKDMRDLSREKLVSHLGPKTGAKLWDYARGIDKTEVGVQTMRKSVSAEINWGIRFVNQNQAEEFVQSLSEELHRRLVENLVKGKQLTIRVMRRSADAPLEPVKHLGHGKCDVFNKSVLLGVAANASDIIGKEAIAMLRSFGFNPGDLRGLGVQMTKLEPAKSTSGGGLESSQRQLNFKASPVAKRAINMADPDLIESPHKGDGASIDAVNTLDNRPTFDSSLKPLNVLGTQFIMPTQPDPKVVAELPADIRSMLVRKPKEPRETSPCPAPRQRVSTGENLPLPSQIDPDILKALPEDIQSEILGYYGQPSSGIKPASPQFQPQSPPPPSRPVRAAPFLKRPTTPIKKRRGRPPKSLVNASKPAARSGLMQSNFDFGRTRTEPETIEQSLPAQDTETVSEISEDFLAALPEDIRAEVLEEHRQQRMRQRSNLVAPVYRRTVASRPTTPAESSTAVATEKRIQLSPRADRPTFTSKKLSTLPDLREAITAWYSAFSREAPFVADVEALALYLKRVVLEERDLEKAVSVADWLAWLIRNDEDAMDRIATIIDHSQSSQAETTWDEALNIVQRSVTAAVEERGLPPPKFSA
ncbi:DNA damage repair protein Mus42, putative [Talaromyces stipitatus ATCC 10500]|uniref:DNA repair protein REV1 n=1 Tax=Talaromyces stipitatus (strain ATCC 10500 / CBS 375.48 / QM 6759 / NRRL 1006) TaxID=441959 RepID=B8LYS3_TALSN|nr:DNA damage repair protein Mus42, putative [Talaromyces stipitatus ATCC 10500]EED23431.1 DNA damage repair protein Mus42, putative [Talaromyces stipitatus ATCC 10500]